MGKRIAGLMLSTAMLATVGGAGTAAAADTTGAAQAAHGGGGDHCVLSLESGELSCFRTATEAERTASNWVFRFYPKPKYKGQRTLTVTYGSGRCPKGVSKPRNYRNLRRVLVGHTYENWNNRISSLKSHNNCRVKLFAKKRYRGHHTKWLNNERRLGRVPDPGDNWNNAATSLAFKGK